jgi:DNA-binding response OmpR family regulator
MSLLILDDEPDIVAVISEIVADISPNIYTATRPHDAIKIFNNHKIDAIFSDIRMPNMTGIEFLSEVRKLSKDVPFVFLTAANDKESMLASLRLRVDEFIEKPFCSDKIRETAKKLLDLGRAQRESLEDADFLLNMATRFFRNDKWPKEIQGDVRQKIRHLRNFWHPSNRITCGNISINLSSLEVELEGSIQKLTAKELDILLALVRNLGNIVNRKQLIHEVWKGVNVCPRNIDSQVKFLRKKVSGFDHEIITVYGAGYTLRPKLS